jgi:hypothetical protein
MTSPTANGWKKEVWLELEEYDYSIDLLLTGSQLGAAGVCERAGVPSARELLLLLPPPPLNFS